LYAEECKCLTLSWTTLLCSWKELCLCESIWEVGHVLVI